MKYTPVLIAIAIGVAGFAGAHELRVGIFAEACQSNTNNGGETQLPPNDPDFRRQSSFHNVGQSGGTIDADVDALEAWEITTGSMQTVVGAMDTGLDYTHPDLYLNIWLNEAEIPTVIKAQLKDVDGDGLLTFRDLNAPVNASLAKDVNRNGYIDGGDLLNDPAWENGQDEDGNGFTDDLVGWDCCDDDNDAFVQGRSRHGTAIARHIGAMGNNGVGGAGLNWKIRMVRAVGFAFKEKTP